MLAEQGPLSFEVSIADGKDAPLAITNEKKAKNKTADEKVVKP